MITDDDGQIEFSVTTMLMIVTVGDSDVARQLTCRDQCNGPDPARPGPTGWTGPSRCATAIMPVPRIPSVTRGAMPHDPRYDIQSSSHDDKLDSDLGRSGGPGGGPAAHIIARRTHWQP